MKILSQDKKTIVTNPDSIFVKNHAQYSSDGYLFSIVAESSNKYRATLGHYKTEEEAISELLEIYRCEKYKLSSLTEESVKSDDRDIANKMGSKRPEEPSVINITVNLTSGKDLTDADLIAKAISNQLKKNNQFFK